MLSAIEIKVFKPNSITPPAQRGVHENLWIKQRFKQYLSIGVYLEGSDLKYYFFEDCGKSPKIYSSLLELKKDLPSGIKDIFDNAPKLFVMGHGRGDCYGLGNHPVEICGTNFDKVITDFEDALPKQHDDIFVTLEACNTDNTEQATRGNQKKTFLARLSETHKSMTFSGTGPWDYHNPQTGYRASGGFPRLNVPITAMSGGIWKHGNSVIFYHNHRQLSVRKSIFSSTKTAKELKINTVEYVVEVLKQTSLGLVARKEIESQVCARRDVLNIHDLQKIVGFPREKYEGLKIEGFIEKEKNLSDKDKNNYLQRIQGIIARAKSRGRFADKDLLVIALGLKKLSVFKGHKKLRDEILTNKELLSLLMVTCGKVLIAGKSNNCIIDLLIKRGVDINSVDEKGMTALHYAAQNFFNYRKEPLDLIKKLIECNVNLKAKDNKGRTPLMVATVHSKDKRVIASGDLLKLLRKNLIDKTSREMVNKKGSATHRSKAFKL